GWVSSLGSSSVAWCEQNPPQPVDLPRNFKHEGVFFDPANFGFTNSGSTILYHHDDKPIR
ncbi:MAG TPA: hypothetical protein VFN02_17245, partial [Ktedonobacteraceae bacterium]|nr:hypothetical protein [Ktedonobacteraceae bacterium]